MDDRQVELESKVAFLEHTVDALNDVVLEQGRALEDLERRVDRSEERLRALKPGEGPEGDPREERPPHH